ncbi:DUF6186 family protein [Asanoa sp. NPDC049573]|uniref:DUF6186 family protein n=1 Tax=Asanoa sp. NPDC049573 TaxID=3155396 RepID=UPI0034455F0F
MSPRSILILGFGLIFGAMAVVDLVSRRRGRGPQPLATALTAAMRTGLGRVLVLGWWCWIGYHFLAR